MNSGMKLSDYHSLKVFSCLAFAHIRQEKLELRALRCVFVGYPRGIKDYMLWCIESDQRKCIISRDVTFNESVMGYKHDGVAQDIDGRLTYDSYSVEVEATTEDHETKKTDQGPHINEPLHQAEEDDGDKIEQDQVHEDIQLRNALISEIIVLQEIGSEDRYTHPPDLDMHIWSLMHWLQLPI